MTLRVEKGRIGEVNQGNQRGGRQRAGGTHQDNVEEGSNTSNHRNRLHSTCT